MPIRRAIQRDEEAIGRWRDEVWPDLRRRARRERRALVFEDESGFYLLPGVVRTYAPEAQTPVIREKQTRDHLSVMGGMTPEGKVYTLVRQESLNGLHSIEFLAALAAVAGERLLVIWDGSPIHRRAAVREFVAQTQGQGLAGGAAGVRPGPEPVGRGGLAPPQERRDAQPGLSGPGGVARGVPPRRRSPAPEASSGPILLRSGRTQPPTGVTFFAQRSVNGASVASRPSSSGGCPSSRPGTYGPADVEIARPHTGCSAAEDSRDVVADRHGFWGARPPADMI